MTGPFFYSAYGLTLSSEIELPELRPAPPTAPDIRIRVRAIAGHAFTPERVVFTFGPEEQYLSWPQVARFLVRGDDTVDIEPAEGAAEAMIRLPLLGAITALLLHLRGFLVLHASAVSVNGQGVIFMGDKRAGKSTTAAALVAAGHRLLADDVVALDLVSPLEPRLYPAFPQIKLAPEAAAQFCGRNAEDLDSAIEALGKVQYRPLDAFASSSVVARRCYGLTRTTGSTTIEEMPAQTAFAQFLRFSYISRFPKALLPGRPSAGHFRDCAAMAPTYQQLSVPDRLDRLHEAVAEIERDVAVEPAFAAARAVYETMASAP